MSGSFYTPYSAFGSGPGTAFTSGFSNAQSIERAAAQLDEANQLQKLRQIEEERQAQAFPLRMQLAEQQMKFAAQTQPLTLEGLRLRNQQIQSNLALTAQQRAAAAELARSFLTGGGAMPAPTNPQPQGPPSFAPPSGGYQGLLPPTGANQPAAPAPREYSPFGGDVVAPGPQSSLDLGVQRFGDRGFDRRFAGMQLASAGINDVTGLPTGMTPEMLEPDYQQYPQTGFPMGQEGPSPTAPGALPAAMLPPEQRAGAVAPVVAPAAPPALPSPTGRLPLVRPDIIPSPSNPRLMDAAVAELSANPSLQTPDVVQRVAGQYGVDPNALAQRLGVTLPAQTAARPTTATEPAPFGESVPGLAGSIPVQPDYTVAPTEGGPAGLRPAGQPTQQEITNGLITRINQYSADAPDPTSPTDPWRVGVESRTHDNEERSIALGRRRVQTMRTQAALLVRSGDRAGGVAMATAADNAEIELENRSNSLAITRANLNGRINISEFAAGNYGPLANDIYQASGGRLRIQPVEGTDKFNIVGPDGSIRDTRTRAQLINDGRMLYDNNYKTQMEGVRNRHIARQEELFKATVRGLEESFKAMSAATKDIAVETAKKEADARFRGTDMKVTIEPQSGVIFIQDSHNVVPSRALKIVPARDRNGRPIPQQWAVEEVDMQARQTR